MSTVREFHTPNRLTRFVNTAEGVTLTEALARADANIAEIRPPSLAHIDQLLAELGMRAPQAAPPAEVARLYRIAGELAGVAGVFGLEPLGRAAFSLCELLDAFATDQAWSAAAVSVHLDGLRLLRQDGERALSPEAAEAVLDGLHKVKSRFAPTDPC